MNRYFEPVLYQSLNARQRENYNFAQVSAALADLGFSTIRLSDDWHGADFIALHVDGERMLRVQLKGRVSFYKKYSGRDLHIAFPDNGDWYVYPHDLVLQEVRGKLAGTASWDQQGGYSYPTLSQWLKTILQPYRLPNPDLNS